MGILSFLNPKAPVKYVARKASDSAYNKDKKKVQQSSYELTGKKMREASRKGKRVNGKELYQKTYDSKMEPIKQKKIRRDKFIDEI